MILACCNFWNVNYAHPLGCCILTFLAFIVPCWATDFFADGWSCVTYIKVYLWPSFSRCMRCRRKQTAQLLWFAVKHQCNFTLFFLRFFGDLNLCLCLLLCCLFNVLFLVTLHTRVCYDDILASTGGQNGLIPDCWETVLVLNINFMSLCSISNLISLLASLLMRRKTTKKNWWKFVPKTFLVAILRSRIFPGWMLQRRNSAECTGQPLS